MILFRSHDFSAIMIESGRKLGDKTRCQIRQPQYLALIQYVSKPSNFKQWSTSITTCALSHSSRKGNAWNEARRARQTSKEQGLYWNKHDQAQSFALSSHVNYWTKPQLVKDTNKEISNEWQKKKCVFGSMKCQDFFIVPVRNLAQRNSKFLYGTVFKDCCRFCESYWYKLFYYHDI